MRLAFRVSQDRQRAWRKQLLSETNLMRTLANNCESEIAMRIASAKRQTPNLKRRTEADEIRC
jgi:hypothetical protein